MNGTGTARQGINRIGSLGQFPLAKEKKFMVILVHAVQNLTTDSNVP